LREKRRCRRPRILSAAATSQAQTQTSIVQTQTCRDLQGSPPHLPAKRVGVNVLEAPDHPLSALPAADVEVAAGWGAGGWGRRGCSPFSGCWRSAYAIGGGPCLLWDSCSLDKIAGQHPPQKDRRFGRMASQQQRRPQQQQMSPRAQKVNRRSPPAHFFQSMPCGLSRPLATMTIRSAVPSALSSIMAYTWRERSITDG
jgi:hypothetical protein